MTSSQMTAYMSVVSVLADHGYVGAVNLYFKCTFL